jgi:protein arginine N-methyltransferase 1
VTRINDYEVIDYARMLVDEIRMSAYVNALKSAIYSESVVLDLGTGTGFFAILACKLGAKRVFAIEPSDSIMLGKEGAIANGCSDRVVFLQGSSFDIALPEPVDIIVSDLRGVVPLYGKHVRSIADARVRFLKPGGKLIPMRDRIYAALVTNTLWYEETLKPFSRPRFGVDTSCFLRFLSNRFYRNKSQPEDVLTNPIVWLELDYRVVEESSVRRKLKWVVDASGMAHGISLWFDAEVDERTGFSTAPEKPDSIYGRGFLPWSSPVYLETGDIVTVQLDAIPMEDDYIWRWHSRVESARGGGEIKAEFRQSTWNATVVSPALLRKQADRFVPSLTLEGEVDHFILARMREGSSLVDISRKVAERFSDTFSDAGEALSRVKAMSSRYSL